MRALRTSSWRTLGLGAAMVACAAPCLADDAVADDVVAASVPAHALHAVSALALQRDDAAEGAPAPRDVPLPAVAPAMRRWRTSGELVGDAYHLSLTRGHLDLGMSFDMATRASRPHDVRIDSQGPVISSLPSVSLGLLNARDTPASSLLARAGAGSDRESESRVGVQWKPAQSQVSFLREGLGMRLDNNESITMRLRKGLFGVYLQRRF